MVCSLPRGDSSTSSAPSAASSGSCGEASSTVGRTEGAVLCAWRESQRTARSGQRATYLCRQLSVQKMHVHRSIRLHRANLLTTARRKRGRHLQKSRTCLVHQPPKTSPPCASAREMDLNHRQQRRRGSGRACLRLHRTTSSAPCTGGASKKMSHLGARALFKLQNFAPSDGDQFLPVAAVSAQVPRPAGVRLVSLYTSSHGHEPQGRERSLGSSSPTLSATRPRSAARKQCALASSRRMVSRAPCYPVLPSVDRAKGRESRIC